MIKTKLAGGLVHNVPVDLGKVLNSSEKIFSKWNSLTPIQRNEWICWIVSGKKVETRGRRIDKTISKLKDGMRRPCCWAGCEHR
jgi:uncharacterized protein YdeI (YjbR/CyaY-like superfamily)